MNQVADAWQRTAIHSETGLVTLRQLLLARHESPASSSSVRGREAGSDDNALNATRSLPEGSGIRPEFNNICFHGFANRIRCRLPKSLAKPQRS